MTSPVNNGGRARLPLEEIVDLLPVQTRLVEVRQLPRNLGVRELLELFTELHERKLVLQGRSHLTQRQGRKSEHAKMKRARGEGLEPGINITLPPCITPYTF